MRTSIKEDHVQLKQQTYASYLWKQSGIPSEGMITDFMSRRNGHLYLGDRVNLTDVVERYGTPLEVVYYPQITTQVQRMHAWAAAARQRSGYRGAFLYAYATKANFAAEVVQTALAAGAHYETSSATDVTIAHYLWNQGILPQDRLICCNGSKEAEYLEAIRNLRLDGNANVLPIIDDLDELDELLACPVPLQLGVRDRRAGSYPGHFSGSDRFGLLPDEIDRAVQRLRGTPHNLVLYHAMVDSQIEDRDLFVANLHESIVAYCRLRQRVPTLCYFNFGGGVPTSGYSLDFDFDYAGFLEELMAHIRSVCADFQVPMPDLIGEFGRYTVATHSLYLLEIGQVKEGRDGMPDWCLLNGSLIVSIPDMLLVDEQQFTILPLEDWEREVRPVRLAGRRTCDSDDVYPRLSQEPLMLPATMPGAVVAVCGIGAYQQMISGVGGAHHCLSPEPRRVTISEVAGHLVVGSAPPQDQASIMQLLGYQPERLGTPLRQVQRLRAS